MKRLTQGRSKTQVLVHSMALTTDDEYLHHGAPFWLDVEFWYEPELRFAEDDPGCPEYIEIISATMVNDVLFSGVLTHIDVHKGGSVLKHITNEQYEELGDMVVSQAKEESYYNADANRPEPDEIIRREMGWGFHNAEYDRDAS